ncbi:MAG: SpoIIE family protein phosphatase [Gammaproteobacteria bacterium]|nr:SpoIIE family protein phosphatase [Gammaproteobacteria bacterium]
MTDTLKHSDPPPQEASGTALVVDDELTNRIILKSLLLKMGYSVLQAENGQKALDLFKAKKPDIVFMDVMMPVMDGYEATAEIKKIDQQGFIPIIFLTAMSDEKDLARCIEVGGDDFLSKPFSHTVLRAKIRAMERISSLHQEISILYDRMKTDEAMAETVFNRAVHANNVAPKEIRTLLKPAEIFSGDLHLSAYSPSQDLFAMLGDFTGHGLAAALGALPTSEVFRAMIAKGFSTHQVLEAINKKLHGLMPTGMFFAVQFISMSKDLDCITVCNCGMPDVLLIDGQSGEIKSRFPSVSLPLGVIPDLELEEVTQHAAIKPGDRILLVSDGVAEARNPDRKYFGRERFEQSIAQPVGDGSLITGIEQALAGFCQNAPQGDDISLVEIPCIPEIIPVWSDETIDEVIVTPTTSSSAEEVLDGANVEFNLTLSGSRLKQTDPVPLVLHHLDEIQGISKHRRLLFTILTELYVNALDHGVLALDSEQKHSPNGMTDYFNERSERLNRLKNGFVRISIKSVPMSSGGKVLICIEDSGVGFNIEKLQRRQFSASNTTPSGRGVLLVKELCESLVYSPPGNKVEAAYCWSDN